MTTTRVSPNGAGEGPRIRPRVHDVTDEAYDRVTECVGDEDGRTYLERRGGRTYLVVR